MEEEILLDELKGCCEYFYHERNEKNGLVRDMNTKKNICSIASVGFSFCATICGIKRGWLEYKKGYDMTKKTIDTFLNMPNERGFFYHFIDMETTERIGKSEISIIDTALLVAGMLCAGEFFGGEIKQKAQQIYDNINWNWYTNIDSNQFYMGYKKEIGFFGHWDWYAEQLLLYVMGIGSDTHKINIKMYNDIVKEKKSYKNIKDIYYSYFGALFTYQFSHAFIDLKNRVDHNGIDWFENSIKATKSNREFCIDHSEEYKTYGENSWGLTPCMSPDGYKNFGASPSYEAPEHDGTITPCGAIGSIVFTPQLSIDAMKHYLTISQLNGKYGFKDSYNLDKNWYAEEYLGIDKGISLVMIENYLSRTFWELFEKNECIKRGIESIFEAKK